MSEKNQVSAEELTKIGGGDCTVADVVQISDKLIDAYENLIEFTTYMMERVNGQ
jgi:hypothetical protein